MSYILEKPYTSEQREDFIVEYNHNRALNIEETQQAIIALEPWEYLDNNGSIINNKEHWDEEQIEQERQLLKSLTMTKADFWIALLDKNITKSKVREKIELIPEEKLRQKTLIRLDDAEKYWRGDEAMDILAKMFGIDSDELDYLFQNGKFPVEEENSDA